MFTLLFVFLLSKSKEKWQTLLQVIEINCAFSKFSTTNQENESQHEERVGNMNTSGIKRT